MRLKGYLVKKRPSCWLQLLLSLSTGYLYHTAPGGHVESGAVRNSGQPGTCVLTWSMNSAY